jgi:hypothetical protein
MMREGLAWLVVMAGCFGLAADMVLGEHPEPAELAALGLLLLIYFRLDRDD